MLSCSEQKMRQSRKMGRCGFCQTNGRFFVTLILVVVAANLILSERNQFINFTPNDAMGERPRVPVDRPGILNRTQADEDGVSHLAPQQSGSEKPGDSYLSTKTQARHKDQEEQKSSLQNVLQQPRQVAPPSFEPLPYCQGLRLPGADMEAPNGTIFYKKFRQRPKFHQSRWGNVVAPYWAARTIAEIGGYAYEGVDLAPGTWMQYLPKKVAAQPPRPDAYNRTCESCRGNLVHFHECPYGWPDVRKTIVADTRRALDAYSKTRPKNETEQVHFWSSTNDWLIYERCCILCHHVQGIGNIHSYDVIPTEGNLTVYTLSPPNIDEDEGHHLCSSLQSRRNEYIQTRNPQLKIVALEPAELWVDFARLVYAPNLLIPSSGTSWGLWSMAANNGTVYTVTPVRKMTADSIAHASTGNFHVMASVPVVHDPEELNLTAEDLETPSGRRRVLEWFVDDIALLDLTFKLP